MYIGDNPNKSNNDLSSNWPNKPNDPNEPLSKHTSARAPETALDFDAAVRSLPREACRVSRIWQQSPKYLQTHQKRGSESDPTPASCHLITLLASLAGSFFGCEQYSPNYPTLGK